MSNIYQLQQFISTYRTYNEVKDKAFQIDQFWRESSFSRALRASTEIEAVHLENKPLKPIVGYKPKHVTTAQILPNSAPRKPISEDLNSQLIEVLRKVPLSWDSQEHIRSINLAIKSKNEYLKKSVLSQYQ